jgi:phosphonatase-like hydrolase
MPPALVVFDLVGTTAEDQPQIAVAFQEALADEGIVIGPPEILAVRGTSKRQAISSLVPQGRGHSEQCDAVYARFRRYLLDAYQANAPQAIPGAVRVFEHLRRNEIRVALNTGFERELAQIILDTLNWPAGSYDAVVCGDDVPHGRPAPDLIFKAMQATNVDDVRRVANVGDTANDLLAGFHAGVCWNIGVLSGAHDRATLAAAPHTHLLASIADLPSAIF